MKMTKPSQIAQCASGLTQRELVAWHSRSATDWIYLTERLKDYDMAQHDEEQALYAAVPAQSSQASDIAAAIERCDWSGASIGNKTILRAAINVLRGLSPDGDVPAEGASGSLRAAMERLADPKPMAAFWTLEADVRTQFAKDALASSQSPAERVEDIAQKVFAVLEGPPRMYSRHEVQAVIRGLVRLSQPGSATEEPRG